MSEGENPNYKNTPPKSLSMLLFEILNVPLSELTLNYCLPNINSVLTCLLWSREWLKIIIFNLMYLYLNYLEQKVNLSLFFSLEKAHIKLNISISNTRVMNYKI